MHIAIAASLQPSKYLELRTSIRSQTRERPELHLREAWQGGALQEEVLEIAGDCSICDKVLLCMKCSYSR